MATYRYLRDWLLITGVLYVIGCLFYWLEKAHSESILAAGIALRIEDRLSYGLVNGDWGAFLVIIFLGLVIQSYRHERMKQAK